MLGSPRRALHNATPRVARLGRFCGMGGRNCGAVSHSRPPVPRKRPSGPEFACCIFTESRNQPRRTILATTFVRPDFSDYVVHFTKDTAPFSAAKDPDAIV